MGQGDPGRQHQGGVKTAKALYSIKPVPRKCRLMALLGPWQMSDLSPQSGPKRTCHRSHAARPSRGAFPSSRPTPTPRGSYPPCRRQHRDPVSWSGRRARGLLCRRGHIKSVDAAGAVRLLPFHTMRQRHNSGELARRHGHSAAPSQSARGGTKLAWKLVAGP